MIVRELLARMKIDVDGAGFKKAEAAIKGLKSGFEKLGTVTAGAYAGLQAITQSAAEQAREIANAARVTGMSTDAIQGLQAAARRAGVPAEELQHGLVHLARGAREAMLGTGEAAGVFQRLGIAVTDSVGKMRPLSDLVGDVAERFSKMPDGTEKAALSVHLLGRAGAELIPFLDQGKAGIAAFAARARELGAIMDSNTIAAGVRFRGAVDEFSLAVSGAKNAIAGQLFPVMQKSMEQLTRWIAIHRKWIALKVKEAFVAVSSVLHHLAAGAIAIVNALEKVWKMGGLARGALVALGIAVAAFIAPWTLLASTIALVAEDVSLFFTSHGKAKTLAGLLVMGMTVLRDKLLGLWDELKKKWGEFTADPFGWLLTAAKKVFGEIVEEARKLPGQLRAAMEAATEHKEGEKSVLQNIGSLNPMVRLGILNSDWVSGALQSAFAPQPAMTFAPAGPAFGGGFRSSINIGQVHVTAPPGSGPAGFAQAFKEEIQRIAGDDFHLKYELKLREASHALDKHNTRP